MSKTEEIEITEENFNQYFRDVRTSSPERGDIIAQYSASAELVDGNEKRQIVSLLTSTENKMEATAQVMRRLLFASELDSYRVPRQMAEDILSGLSVDDVVAKPYKYTLEMFFYTKPENMPKDDPHWSSISVLNIDEFFDKKNTQVQSKILSPEESKKLNSELTEVIKNEVEISEFGQDAICGDARGIEVPKAQ